MMLFWYFFGTFMALLWHFYGTFMFPCWIQRLPAAGTLPWKYACTGCRDINATGKYIYKTKGEPISVEECTEENNKCGLIINKDYVDKRIMMPAADLGDEKFDKADYLSMFDHTLLHGSELSCYISVKISKTAEESDTSKNTAEKTKEEKSVKLSVKLRCLVWIGTLFITLLMMLLLFGLLVLLKHVV